MLMEPEGQLFVPAKVVDSILAHAREDAPRECCGLLLGAGRDVVRAVRTRNARAGTTRYLVDPADHFMAIREARSAGLSIVGAYHSHPASAPTPSPRDLSEGTYEFFYLIASLADPAGPEIRAFALNHGNFRPLQLVRLTGVPG
ncbi:MAG TPA: M67 family metallopeptidase [Vicinamibacterales bacterium]